MRAKYTPDKAVITLDRSEAIIVMRALNNLRYSTDASVLTGSQLLDLAAMSQTWLCMCQDMNSPAAEERCRTHNEVEALRDIAETAGPREEERVNGGAY